MSNQNNLTSVILPSSEADLLAIQKVLKEVSDCMTRMDSEKDFIKDALSDLSKQYQIPKAMLTRVAKAFHKRNIAEERAKTEDVFYLYDGIFSIVKNKKSEE